MKPLASLQKKEIEIMAKERPYALMAIQTQILYDIASMLEDQGKTLIDFFESWKKTIPIGLVIPRTYAITSRVTILNFKNTLHMPWQKVTIFIDGPAPVFIKVNETDVQTHTPLNMGEQLTIDMVKPLIETITLVCAPGLTSTIRIFARK